MKKLRFLVSLITDQNDYQRALAASAQDVARRSAVDVHVVYADNDPITQIQQLLNAIQSKGADRPDGVVCAPAGGTALPQVARAAAAAGVGWAVLDPSADYLGELRGSASTPVFAVSADHKEIGRIQGRQMGALLPEGGAVLYIQGPSASYSAKQRAEGMNEARPKSLRIKLLHSAHWTEASGKATTGSWLALPIEHMQGISVVAAQNDAMAMGAHKAFQEMPAGEERTRWLSLPLLGVDGLPGTGQDWLAKGLLAATVVVPPTAGPALEMMVQALQTGVQPKERSVVPVKSLPEIAFLTPRSRVGQPA